MRACILNIELTSILYVLANENFHFESDIIYGTPSVNMLTSMHKVKASKKYKLVCEETTETTDLL
jgi:hypothetical protein